MNGRAMCLFATPGPPDFRRPPWCAGNFLRWTYHWSCVAQGPCPRVIERRVARCTRYRSRQERPAPGIAPGQNARHSWRIRFTIHLPRLQGPDAPERVHPGFNQPIIEKTQHAPHRCCVRARVEPLLRHACRLRAELLSMHMCWFSANVTGRWTYNRSGNAER